MKLARRLRRWRSAITGLFVTKRFADEHPDTTVGEDVRLNPQDRDLDFDWKEK